MNNKERQQIMDDTVNPNYKQGSKVAVKFIYFALLIITAVVGVFIYWAVQPTDILNIKNSPFPTRTIREHPTAGGVIILTVDFCKNVDIDGKLRVSYVSDSREIFLPIGDERGHTGCAQVELPVIIPKDIPADTYKIKFRATYDINPLKQDVIEEFESKPVEVVPNTPTNDK